MTAYSEQEIAAILGANTQARGILFDQTPVMEGAREFIAQVGLETRCELINMLMVLGRCERTEAEYKHLLEAAGFRMTEVIPTRSPLTLIEGVPAHAAS